MPKTIYLKTLGFILIILCLWGIVSVVFLPLKKSLLALESLQKGQLILATRYPSPISQEDILRQYGNQLVSLLEKFDLPREYALWQIETYEIETKRLFYERQGKINPTVFLLIIGQLWHLFGLRYGDMEALQHAEKYYRLGLAFSPNRPEFTNGLKALTNFLK